MPHPQALSDEFVALTHGRVRFDEPMKSHTTFHIGGPAEIWVEPQTQEELRQLLGLAHEAALPVTVVGGGANLLVSDHGVRGLVIHVGHQGFQDYRRTEETVVVGAALPLEWLIRRSQEAALHGVEFLAGVPGRVGGAVRMNAGTHDEEGKPHSLSDVIRSITVMDLGGRRRTLTPEQIGFGYRRSDIPHQIVLEATLSLVPDDPMAIAERVKRLWEFKRETQDWTNPSAGCIFKNPSQGPSAGWMIERVGLKGYKIGGAIISPIHGNFMMNCGEAKAADVLALIEEVRSRVRRDFRMELELEVQMLPSNGDK